MLKAAWGCVCVLVVSSLVTLGGVDASDWTRFRGPNGTGQAGDQTIPVQWTAKNILWQTPMPGPGNSSPVVWQDKLYVQVTTSDASERMLLCMDLKTGAIVWTKTVSGHASTIHEKNTMASATPGVDADGVYASFWDGTDIFVAGYTHSGQQRWMKNLGKFTSQHGAGASPIPIDGKVYFVNDQDGKADLYCFDPLTGETVWSAKRPAHRACYSSPYTRTLPDGRKELLIVSTMGITGYDPGTGAQHWDWKWPFRNKKMPLRTTGSSIYDHGILFATSGDGDGPRHAVAVRLDPPTLVWENLKDLPYVPSLLSKGKFIYFVNDTGWAGCVEAETGKKMWFDRLEGGFCCSPVMVGDRIYASNEYGDMFVWLATPDRLEILAKNSLGETIRGTPAVVNDRMYIHGHKNMFCIGNP
jgi:outer membrane protein assembly factor BamB